MILVIPPFPSRPNRGGSKARKPKKSEEIDINIAGNGRVLKVYMFIMWLKRFAKLVNVINITFRMYPDLVSLPLEL